MRIQNGDTVQLSPMRHDPEVWAGTMSKEQLPFLITVCSEDGVLGTGGPLPSRESSDLRVKPTGQTPEGNDRGNYLWTFYLIRAECLFKLVRLISCH